MAAVLSRQLRQTAWQPDAKITQIARRNVSYDIVSDENHTREGLCVYCGTRRPVAKPICPECGRTWIDTRIDEDLPALTPEVVAASADQRQATTEVDMPPPPDERSGLPWGILIGALAGIAIIYFLVTSVLGGDGEETATATTSTETTSAPSATSTTVATTTTTPTTTTSSTTTTTSSTTTTTTTTTTTVPPIEPVGSAVPVEELTLGAFGFGPFGFGAETSYLGRLVASLGQPDSMNEAGTELGLCEGDEGVAYTWDGLTAIFRVSNGVESLVGYRLVETGSEHPTQSITSRSGLELGHTVATLDAIYLQSNLDFQEIDGTPHFVLLRSSDSATLLWGPVTDTGGEGIVEGIYSPRACDGGPSASP
jgi:hypothetical protein